MFGQVLCFIFFFFFNDTATTEIYTLSLHDALPIFADASVDAYNSKCVRSSAGSLFHLPLVLGVRPDQAVAALRAAGLAVLAADGGASTGLDDLAAAGQLARPT